MAYTDPNGINTLPIEDIKTGGEFVLVKFKKIDEYTPGGKRFYYVENKNKVAVTFGDHVLVTNSKLEATITYPYQVGEVVAMFNDLSDYFSKTLLNESLSMILEVNFIERIPETIICNITNPENPQGSNTGGMNVSSQDSDGNTVNSSEGNQNNGQNGNSNNNQNGNTNQNGSNGSFSFSFGESEQNYSGNYSHEFGTNPEDAKKENEQHESIEDLDIFNGKLFKFKTQKK